MKTKTKNKVNIYKFFATQGLRIDHWIGH